MGMRWGRQIAVAMTEADEKRFLAFLRSTTDIQIFITPEATREELTVDDLPPRKSGKKQFFIWNAKFPWTPDSAEPSNGRAYIRDINRAPVIEYGRDSFGRMGDTGRVFWSKGVTPGGPYSFMSVHHTYAYDAAEFEKWYKQVVHWIKQNSKPEKARGGLVIYYFPGAWLWRGWYKSR